MYIITVPEHFISTLLLVNALIWTVAVTTTPLIGSFNHSTQWKLN